MGEEENKVVREICDFLMLYKDIFFWRQNNGATYDTIAGKFRSLPRYGLRGISDILGIYKGKFLAIEVKRQGGLLSVHQHNFLKAIRESGGIAFLAYSYEDVIEHLGHPNNS